METKNKHIVYKPSIVETIKALPKGKPITFNCSDVGPYISAKVAVMRLNKKANNEDYSIDIHDNGASYTITRNV